MLILATSIHLIVYFIYIYYHLVKGSIVENVQTVFAHMKLFAVFMHPLPLSMENFSMKKNESYDYVC